MDEEAIANRKRALEAEDPAAVGTSEASGGISAPVAVKRVRKSWTGVEKKPRDCQFCKRPILCPVLPSGKVHETNLRRHEKLCPQNPDSVVVSVRGLKVDAVFGAFGSDAEFQAPEDVRKLTQGARGLLEDAKHVFSDGSWHFVKQKTTGKFIRADHFFVNGARCCFPEEQSMIQFRVRPDLYPKLYKDGKCVIAEIGTEQVENAPAPWTTSVLRSFSLNFFGTINVFDTRCQNIIQMSVNGCAQGMGPCRDCTGTRPNDVLYERSFQNYLDRRGLNWTTVPSARTILMNHPQEVQMTCHDCGETWPRDPNDQVQQTSACPGCNIRHRAELCAFELYVFVFPEANMFPRGQARLEGVHDNPYDVASNVPVIVEVMSLRWHVEKGKLPNDTEKMLNALCKGRVFVLAHDEDHGERDQMNWAWQRSLVHALKLARDDRTPRLIHVRRDTSWTHYDCMRDAAVAAGFPYEDVFCGHANAHATVKLPRETTRQTILDV